MPRVGRWTALVVAAGIALAGCASPVAGSGLTASLAESQWVVPNPGDTAYTPYVVFDADGTWRSSDGCNIVQGDWSVEGGDGLSTTSGPHTLIGCKGSVAVPTKVAAAHFASVKDGTLTLYDADKNVLIELVAGDAPQQGRAQVAPITG